MQQMVENGEVRSLVPERLWRELERALQEPHPGKPASIRCRPAKHCRCCFPNSPGASTSSCVLQAAVNLSADPTVRFAALLGGVAPIGGSNRWPIACASRTIIGISHGLPHAVQGHRGGPRDRQGAARWMHMDSSNWSKERLSSAGALSETAASRAGAPKGRSSLWPRAFTVAVAVRGPGGR